MNNPVSTPAPTPEASPDRAALRAPLRASTRTPPATRTTPSSASGPGRSPRRSTPPVPNVGDPTAMVMIATGVHTAAEATSTSHTKGAPAPAERFARKFQLAWSTAAASTKASAAAGTPQCAAAGPRGRTAASSGRGRHRGRSLRARAGVGGPPGGHGEGAEPVDGRREAGQVADPGHQVEQAEDAPAGEEGHGQAAGLAEQPATEHERPGHEADRRQRDHGGQPDQPERDAEHGEEQGDRQDRQGHGQQEAPADARAHARPAGPDGGLGGAWEQAHE